MASPRDNASDDSVGREIASPPVPVTSEKKDMNMETDVVDLNEEVYHLAEKLGDVNIAPLDDIEYVMDKIEILTLEEAKDIARELLVYHEFDYNFSAALRTKFINLLEGPQEGQSVGQWELELKTEAAICKYFSPYPEVRAITTPTDDINIPCETIRAHLLGYMWVCVGQFTNSLFNSRFPNITLSSDIIQLLLYPCGKLLQTVVPDWGVTIGGRRISLNPGPWTYKEQMLSTIIVDVGLGSAYCFWNIQTQTVYYHDKWLTPEYGILLLLSTQMMGLGFSGMLRRFVIFPVEALWPTLLPTVALNRTLLLPERQETLHGWSISRYKFFFIAFSCMFVYFWIPDYLCPALSYFAWMTWIAPNNFNVNMITGSTLGLGFNPFPTFDWNIMQANFAPLAQPFFALMQQYAGQVFAGLVIVGLYYSNTNWTGYLSPNSSGIFDNTGAPYNITKVIDPNTGVLNEEQYRNYSPAFYTAGALVQYGSFFMFYPLTMVFLFLDSWRSLSRPLKEIPAAILKTIRKTGSTFKNTITSLAHGDLRDAGRHLQNFFVDDGSVYDGFDDPFTNMMRKYPEVPHWWFWMITLVSFVFSIVVLTQFKELGTPVWTIFFVLGLNFVFLVPMTYLSSFSGSTEGLNVVTELIMGYALPGHPEALMFVKAFGYNINGQANNYISDQKMGFYAKVPPRAMYRGQVTSALISAILCYGVVQFVDNTIQGICTPGQDAGFNCENGSQVYFSSSVVWGAIGPKRIFSEVYPVLKYAFLIGFLLAPTWWGIKRFGPRVRTAAGNTLPAAIFAPINTILFTPISWLFYVHPSLFVNGMLGWAPLNLSYSTGAVYVNVAFMWYLRRYKTAWWEKYNYVLSAALTGAVAFSGIIIFFAVQYHPVSLNWWGTEIGSETLDTGAGRHALIPELPKKGFFGPDTWN